MPQPRRSYPPLTKRSVEAAEPDPKGVRFVWDGLVHGFALRVEPTGTKTWVVQKSIGGRTRRITIAKWPDLTVEQARQRAQALVVHLLDGGDPVRERREARRQAELARREGVTMQGLWDRYWAEAVLPHNKPSSAAEKARMWSARIKPAIGRLPVRDVTGTELSAIVRAPLRLHPRTGAIVGGKGEAGNLYRLLHHLFAKALAWRLRPLELGHPLDGIEQPRVERRNRLLSDAETVALLAALQAAEASTPWQVAAAIRLALLTGCRITELLTLRWQDVRRDLHELHLLDTKTGFSVRPLPAEALAVLDGVQRRPGVPWVLPGLTDASKPLAYEPVYRRLRRLAEDAGLPRVHPHLLRHRHATLVASAAENVRAGMAATGHKSLAAFMGYVHAEKRQAAAAAAEAARHTAGLALLEPAGKIVPLTKPRRGRRRG